MSKKRSLKLLHTGFGGSIVAFIDLAGPSWEIEIADGVTLKFFIVQSTKVMSNVYVSVSPVNFPVARTLYVSFPTSVF